MMIVKLPLDQMTVAEKLDVMEQVWMDLARTPEAVPSPEWHGKELGEREARLREGKTRFVDWEEAKRSILEQTE